MNRLGIALLVTVALAAALIASPAAGAAPSGRYTVEPATRVVHFHAAGTNGWQFEVAGILGSTGLARRPIEIFVKGPHHEIVEYRGVKGLATEDGRIAGRIPSFGRIDVRFEQTSKSPVQTSPAPGCTVKGESALLEGIFRGTIEFRGEGGYTKVARTSARGEIWVSPREICPPKKHQPVSDETPRRPTGITSLYSGRRESRGSLTFSMFSTPPEGVFGRLTVLTATDTHKSHGLHIYATTTVDSESSDLFTLTASGGMPTELTLSPPGPFVGSAAFRLESSKQASWTGNLAVELPGRGVVRLAGPDWWAGACQAFCTETFPPGFGVGFGITSSRLP